MKTSINIKSLISIIIVLILTWSIFFFSWLPNPTFKSIPFFPQWLITWTDIHGRLRTAVPFVPLSFFAFVLFRCKTKYVYLGLFFVAFIAESVQIFLPNRVFDWFDILWAVLGSITGKILQILAKSLKNYFSLN